MQRNESVLSTARVCLLAAAAVVCAVPGAAVAQDDDEFEDEDVDDALGADEGGDEGADDAATDDADDALGDDEDDAPADSSGDAASSETTGPAPAEGGTGGRQRIETEETIYAIQKKARLIGDSIEITPLFLQSVNDRFVSQTGGMLSVMYNFRENLAFELNVGTFGWWDNPDTFFQTFAPTAAPRFGGHYTNTTTELQLRERLQPEFVKLYWITWLTTADFQWAPVTGKVSIHDFQLGTFSLYLSVGAGLAGMRNEQAPDLAGPTGQPFIGPVQITATVGGGLRFYILDWLGIRLEVRDYVQPLALLVSDGPDVPTSTFEVRNTIMAQIGLSFVIPMPWGPR